MKSRTPAVLRTPYFFLVGGIALVLWHGDREGREARRNLVNRGLTAHLGRIHIARMTTIMITTPLLFLHGHAKN